MNTLSTGHTAFECACDLLPPVSLRRSTVRKTERNAGPQILVVDDNHDAADSLAQLFGVMGAQVSVAYGAQEALTAMTRARPQIAIIDISMPLMDGYELAARIRSCSSFEGVILIALTGWCEKPAKDNSENMGFDHHLTKPTNVHQLTRLLESIS